MYALSEGADAESTGQITICYGLGLLFIRPLVGLFADCKPIGRVLALEICLVVLGTLHLCAPLLAEAGGATHLGGFMVYSFFNAGLTGGIVGVQGGVVAQQAQREGLPYKLHPILITLASMTGAIGCMASGPAIAYVADHHKELRVAFLLPGGMILLCAASLCVMLPSCGKRGGRRRSAHAVRGSDVHCSTVV
jgi:nitrate/nitrite transporter NarK